MFDLYQDDEQLEKYTSASNYEQFKNSFTFSILSQNSQCLTLIESNLTSDMIQRSLVWKILVKPLSTLELNKRKVSTVLIV